MGLNLEKCKAQNVEARKKGVRYRRIIAHLAMNAGKEKRKQEEQRQNERAQIP